MDAMAFKKIQQIIYLFGAYICSYRLCMNNHGIHINVTLSASV